MSRLSLALCTLAALAGPLVAQPLTLTLNTLPGGNPDNSRLYVVQRSRFPAQVFMIDATGTPGSLAAAVLSLEGNHDATNADLASAFADFSFARLLIPDPFDPNIAFPIVTLGAGPTTVLPFVSLTGASYSNVLADTAFYFQGAAQGASGIDLSGGVTLVDTEPVDSQATPVATVLGLDAGGPVPGASRGAAMVSADFNLDGADDLVVAHPGETAQGIGGAGRVYIYFGMTSPVAGQLSPVPFILEEPTLVYGLGTPPLPITVNSGPRVNAGFGSTLAVGDIDGNGQPDLVIGAPDSDTAIAGPSLREGQVFVYPNLGMVLPSIAPAVATVVSVPSADVWRFRPSPTQPLQVHQLARFSWSLAVGDVDADGFDDLAVGSPFLVQDTATQSERGAVFLYRGRAFGPLIPGTPVGDELENLRRDETGLLSNAAGVDLDHFANALAFADLDQDGDDELLVGMPGEDVGAATDAGVIRTYDYLPGGLQPSIALQEAVPTAFAGLGTALATGDFDGNGFDDVAASSNGDVGGAAQAGRVTLWRFSAGLSSTSELITSLFPAPFERFGRALLAVDHNGDGLDDLVVGAPGSNRAGPYSAGAVEILFGTRTLTFADPHRTLSLTSGAPDTVALFGTALAAGDFAGTGRVRSLAVGEPLNGTSGSFAAGRVAVFRDLLHRTNNGTTLDWFLPIAFP